MEKKLIHKLDQPIAPYGLAIFRILFGLMMAFGVFRFYWKGWIENFYIQPEVQFKYEYFDWVKTPPAGTLYLIFILLFIFAVMIALGLYYKYSMMGFFVLFTFVELLEKSIYLNHYYFISLMSFVLIFIPLNKGWSLDARFSLCKIGALTVGHQLFLKLHIGLVYFFAGVAKINADWLFEGQPLHIWLQANSDFPVFGNLFAYKTTAVLASWAGMLFDLFIPFVMFTRFRFFGFCSIVIFHFVTAQLFFIGMFPWIMIVCSTVYFNPLWLNRWVKNLDWIEPPYKYKKISILKVLASVYLMLHLIIPFRSYLYKGDDKWTGQGFRFSWKVMLVEKTGTIKYKVVENKTKKEWIVNPADQLCGQQVKMLSIELDMILDYAKIIQKEFLTRGIDDISIYAESYVSMNGKPSKRFIKNDENLLTSNPESLFENLN